MAAPFHTLTEKHDAAGFTPLPPSLGWIGTPTQVHSEDVKRLGIAFVAFCALSAFTGGWLVRSSGRPATVLGRLVMVGGVVAPDGSDTSLPVKGEITATDSSGQAVTTPAADDGHFSVLLQAGRYTLTARTPNLNNGRTPCWPSQKVIVDAGEDVVVEVQCWFP